MIEMLSIRDASARYGLSRYILRRWLLSGTIRGVRIGRGKLLINAPDLERFLSESYASEPEKPEKNEAKGIVPVNVR